MSFKKLALVTAMFAATSGAYAMEAMDEEALAAATGQDGITIDISTSVAGITLDQIIHDRNGAAGIDINGSGAIDAADAALSSAGALHITGTKIDRVSAGTDAIFGTADDVAIAGSIKLDIDADGGSGIGATSGPFLNIKAVIGGGTRIATGDISVAKSNNVIDASGVTFAATSNQSGVLITSSTIILGETTANIQLGAEPQGAMIRLNTTMTGGLTVGTFDGTNYAGGFSLNDASSNQTISIGRMRLKDATGSNLTVGDVRADVVAGGLQVNVVSIGTGGLYQSMERVQLGSAPAIGDIEVKGLNLNNTVLTISGH